MSDLEDPFEGAIRAVKIRKGITAFLYRNGTVNIDGEKYLGISITEAVKMYRKKFPRKKK